MGKKVISIDNVVSKGFIFKEFKPGDLSLLSLKIAIKSYFSTYQTCIYDIRILCDSEKRNPEQIECQYSSDYFEAYSETILHFQHFFELFCKRILSNDHALLSDVALDKPEILYKLLHNKELTPAEEAGVKSIEFSETIKRLRALLKPNFLKSYKDYSFLKDDFKTLEILNRLRNRILHKGKFVLEYPALDKFVGIFVLPLVQKILSTPLFSGFEKFWKYKELKCKIDPIEQIVNSFKNEKYKWGKIAYLKELGRAAYHNPIHMNVKRNKNLPKWASTFEEYDNSKEVKKSKAISKAVMASENTTVEECPVCGEETLNVFWDSTEKFDKNNKIIGMVTYSYSVKCHCCFFEVNDKLGNPSKYGFKELKDYFKVKEP